MKYNTVIFDLDGTLLNSKMGIWRSYEYALGKMGYASPKIDNIGPLIGPPIEEVFVSDFGFSPEEAKRAFGYYLEEYVTNGRMFTDPFFEGCKEVLAMLKEMGIVVGIATNKTEKNARAIIANAGLDIPLERVYGPDGKRCNKVDVIRDFLGDFKCMPDKTLLVGDTIYDVMGGLEAGIKTVGVSYGNGRAEDLKNAGAVEVIDALTDLITVLNKF